nr:serine/threonine protein kinase [Pyxidicoccus fallax]
MVPDSEVGPWRVVASLGAGGFGRVFKVERGGRFYSLKMALRPAGPHAAEEEDVNGRLAHEVAALLACAPHPHLPRLHAVDRWPAPPDGYLYFVTDYIDGETFHEWRWRVKPTAAHLLSVFTEVVRVVADLHRRGMHHRDLKGDNLLIRREDERPFVIDLGTVRMPGATTLTVGVAPASPHLLPPECVAFLREGTWQQGAHFDAGVPGDLYALGALLYEALTDGYAFDPKLPYDRLLPAIETVTPRAPHVVNPKVPRALSDIAMRLLAKRPEDRYPNTEALLQALWDVAKEKRQSAWKVSLDRPPEAEAPGESEDTPRVRMVPELVRAPLDTLKPPEPGAGSDGAREPEVAAEPSTALETFASAPLQERGAGSSALVLPRGGDEEASVTASMPERRRSRGAVVGLGVGVLMVLGFAAFGLSRLAPSPEGTTASIPPPPAEKGSPAVTSRSPSSPDASPLAVVPPVPDAGVASDAGLQASALVTGAPDGGVAATPPPKRQASSALKAAAVATCMTAACAGGPQVRTASPEKPCPEDALKFMRELPIDETNHNFGNRGEVTMLPPNREGPVPVPPDGSPVTFYATQGLEKGRLPKGTRFVGQIFRGKDKVYAWVTELVMPNGDRHPFCAQLMDDEGTYGEPGAEYLPGSTPEKPMMNSRVDLNTTVYYGRVIRYIKR